MRDTIQELFSEKSRTAIFWFGVRQFVKTHSAFGGEIGPKRVISFVEQCEIPGEVLGVFASRRNLISADHGEC
jgi:hypothetical protein